MILKMISVIYEHDRNLPVVDVLNWVVTAQVMSCRLFCTKRFTETKTLQLNQYEDTLLKYESKYK